MLDFETFRDQEEFLKDKVDEHYDLVSSDSENFGLQEQNRESSSEGNLNTYI